MQPDLFADPRANVNLAPGARLLAGFALAAATDLVRTVAEIADRAPFRNLTIPGGRRMSVAMTNSGRLGWVSDTRGYRYESSDPASGHLWPPMPPAFRALAGAAADAAGFAGFDPDACLVNRYEPGARMGLHQDRDERDFGAPIVSVSLGLPGIFLWGGARRADRPRRIALRHGDVVVWGGASRLAFHGVAPLAAGDHPEAGPFRYNLTFRRAGA